MLDLHTHILPLMDDGSQSPEESLRMLRMEAEQGVELAVLTPHFYPDREDPQHFLGRRQAAAEKLLDVLQGQTDLPQIRLGAEVRYYDGVSLLEGIEALCVEGTRTLLLEMPFCRWTRRMLDEAGYLRSQRGIQPVLAHVERYLSFQPAGVVAEWGDGGVWMQTNASFFTRWQTSRRALRMLSRREIHFIGSDCHNLTTRRPNLGAAAAKIEKRLGSDAQQHLRRMQEQLLG